jgi:hypothetical protein
MYLPDLPICQPIEQPTRPFPLCCRHLVDAVVFQYDTERGEQSKQIPGDTRNPNDYHDDDKHHQLLGLCASFLPYYTDDDGEFLRVFDRISTPSTNDQSAKTASNTTIQFSAVDFAVGRAVDALSKDVRSDDATIKYLHRLASLKAQVKDLRLSTRIRLQGVIYSLTQPGGPRYASKTVNRLAFRTLDELFPHGKRTRRAINFGFRGLFVFSKLTGVLYYAYIRGWIFFFAMFRAVMRVFARARRGLHV